MDRHLDGNRDWDEEWDYYGDCGRDKNSMGMLMKIRIGIEN